MEISNLTQKDYTTRGNLYQYLQENNLLEYEQLAERTAQAAEQTTKNGQLWPQLPCLPNGYTSLSLFFQT